MGWEGFGKEGSHTALPRTKGEKWPECVYKNTTGEDLLWLISRLSTLSKGIESVLKFHTVGFIATFKM